LSESVFVGEPLRIGVGTLYLQVVP
jgi:hypothetical protein